MQVHTVSNLFYRILILFEYWFDNSVVKDQFFAVCISDPLSITIFARA